MQLEEYVQIQYPRGNYHFLFSESSGEELFEKVWGANQDISNRNQSQSKPHLLFSTTQQENFQLMFSFLESTTVLHPHLAGWIYNISKQHSVMSNNTLDICQAHKELLLQWNDYFPGMSFKWAKQILNNPLINWSRILTGQEDDWPRSWTTNFQEWKKEPASGSLAKWFVLGSLDVIMFSNTSKW